MDEIKLRIPSIWGDDEELSPLLLIRRGAERRNKHREIIVEVLRNVSPNKPTRDNLQKLAGIRRSAFIKALKVLLDKGIVMKFGRGVKDDPFLYGLAPDQIDN